MYYKHCTLFHLIFPELHLIPQTNAPKADVTQFMLSLWRADETLHICAHPVTQRAASFRPCLPGARDHNAKGQRMTITASIDEHEAVTLTYTRMNTTSNLGVPDAAAFADDLKSTFNADQGDIYRDAYNVLVQPEGVTVEVHPHSFPIPWQHIASVVDQLTA